MRSHVSGLLLSMALAPGLIGQAMVEYTLGVGRAVAGAPAAKKAGEAAAASLEKLGKTLEKGGQAATGASKIAMPPAAPKRLGPFADPTTITAGLTRAELLNRFGDPVMKTAGGLGTLAGDTYWYRTAAGGHILAEVREGKVAVVTTEAQRKQASAAVVIVQ